MKNGSRPRPDSIRRALELIRFVFQTLTDDSSAFRIEQQQLDRGIRFMLHLSDGHGQRILGEGGRTLQSLRVLLESLGAREWQRFELELDEPDS